MRLTRTGQERERGRGRRECLLLCLTVGKQLVLTVDSSSVSSEEAQVSGFG